MLLHTIIVIWNEKQNPFFLSSYPVQHILITNCGHVPLTPNCPVVCIERDILSDSAIWAIMVYLWVISLCALQDDFSCYDQECAETNQIYGHAYIIVVLQPPGPARGLSTEAREPV
jgi:hypothetical protein